MVLGSSWLYFKANALLQRFSAQVIRIASTCFAALFCLSCFVAASVQPGVPSAWSVHPICLSLLASLFVILSGSLVAIAGKNRPLLPFILAVGQFFVGMAGIAVIVYPNIVPFRISLWDAAASSNSQIFLLIGASVVSPVVIAYSAFAYWVFRGRTPTNGWE